MLNAFATKRSVGYKFHVVQKLKEWEDEVAACKLLLYSGDMRAWNEVTSLMPFSVYRQLWMLVYVNDGSMTYFHGGKDFGLLFE